MPHFRYGYGVPGPVGSDGTIWRANFDLLPLSTSANAATLRAALAAMGLTLTRASAATVQVSASEVVTSGIGVDDPRVGRYGLVIEESRQSLALRCNEIKTAPWAESGATVTGVDALVSPSGATDADEITVAVGYIRQPIVMPSANAVWSFWGKSGTASKTGRSIYNATAAADVVAIEDVNLTSSWARYDRAFSTTSGNTIYAYPIRNGGTIPAGTFGAWGAQLESGKFGTELILTTGAAATRAGERLYMADSSRVLRSGRVGIELSFRAKGAAGDQNAAYEYLWSLNGNNQAYRQQSDGKIRVWSNGVEYVAPTVATWAAGDVVDIWTEGGGGSLVTVVKYRVNGGAAVTCGVSGAPQAALPSGLPLDLANNSTSAAQLNGWHTRQRAYAPGRRPAWAA